MSAIAAAAMTPVSRAFAADAEPIDAGELSKYAQEGIYPEFQPKGFFIVRRGNRIVAQSSICTHKRCKVKASAEGFACSCHGSRFSIDGKVLKPPARKDLPRHGIQLNDAGHVVVDMSRQYESDDFSRIGSYVDVPA